MPQLRFRFGSEQTSGIQSVTSFVMLSQHLGRIRDLKATVKSIEKILSVATASEVSLKLGKLQDKTIHNHSITELHPRTLE